MSRFYHVDIAQFAADADAKWIDNLLSHFDIPGVEGRRQGVARRISEIGVLHIVLVRRLTREAGVATERAVAMSTQLLTSDTESAILIGGLTLRLDRKRFERDVGERIAIAVESIVPARRGRPPRKPQKHAGRLD